MADEKLEAYEEILLRIDPDTLRYQTSLTYCDVEDLYIVLRDLIYRLETGEIHEMIPMEDENGKPVDLDTFRAKIGELKHTIDERIGADEVVEVTDNNGRGNLN